MNLSETRIVSPLACMVAVALPLSSGHAGERPITDFGEAENRKLGWSITDDGVMGGLSRGGVSFSEAGIMRFSGKLSLENNGGFSTVRTGRLKIDLDDFEGLAMRVKGDGRTYQLRIGSTARYRGMEVSFKADFPTSAGEWREVKVPFSSLRGSWRGRDLPDAKFDASKVKRLGFLIADKKEGEFDLEVDWIRAYPPGAGATAGGGGARTIAELAVADGRFGTLVAALAEADLVRVLEGEGSFTVFAPTDEAFAALPDGTVESLLRPENKEKLIAILSYHLAPGKSGLGSLLEAGELGSVQGEALDVAFAGGKVKVNGAVLVDADIEASNGVIHVIDAVLLPPERERLDVVATARAEGQFGTLLAAAEAAGLVSALEADGPITVFAPTDGAFAELPDGVVASLLEEGNRDKLKEVLANHVVAGRVSAGDALNAGSAKTLSGGELEFAVEGGRLKVGDATLTAVDIECANGLIHVIDAVLLPAETGKGAAGAGSARDRIYSAIEKGVPLYNGGDAAACADVYRECLGTLAEDEHIERNVRRMIAGVIERGEHVEDEARAWLFRRSLDKMLVYLEGR